MKTLKETLEDWVEYFQSEIIAGTIDAIKFPEMSQNDINEFFGNKITRGKVMKRIYRKLKENKHSFEKAKLILSKYNEQPAGNIIEFVQGILPEAFESGSVVKSPKKVSGRHGIDPTVQGGSDDGESGTQDSVGKDDRDRAGI
jgi:hypothetical protein